MPRDHAHPEENGKIDIISIAAGCQCHETTYRLRRRYGKIVIISVGAGVSFYEITHILRR
jgi:hypothetical protein